MDGSLVPNVCLVNRRRIGLLTSLSFVLLVTCATLATEQAATHGPFDPVANLDETMSRAAKTLRSFGVRAAQVTYPSGDKSFSVLQPFPSGFSAEECDPFLMCDDFGPKASKGKATHEDEFPLGWHPHRGQDIVTYMTRGTGRHADSMGNRGEFPSPGMQWISVGSGIEHAEGGGGPRGEIQHGFQIWINVPSRLKMNKPRYGTEAPDTIPQLTYGEGGALGCARLLAGESLGHRGPFRTVADVQMLDFSLNAGGTPILHNIPAGLDNILAYVYDGDAIIGGEIVKAKQIARFEPLDVAKGAALSLVASPDAAEVQDDVGHGIGHAAKVMLFAGKKLNQPIAWHGPFVMTTRDELMEAISEYRNGTFLKHRFPGDYKTKAAMDLVRQKVDEQKRAESAQQAQEETGSADIADPHQTSCAVDGP